MSSSVKRKAADLAAADAKKPKANASITSFFSAPKTAVNGNVNSGTAQAPAIKFDKEKWVSKLSEEQKDLLKLEIQTLHESWLAHLKDEIVTEKFLILKRFLKKEREDGKTIYPPLGDIYSWSRHTPLHTVKAVILGQDPYHNANQAHGLCFSVRPPTPAPPSLKNMYIAIKNDYPSFIPPPNKGGLLTPWAERGVLMINTCLTVREHAANSHANRGWEQFTQKVIDTVAKVRTKGVVFLAWGTPAKKRVARIDSVRHCILQSVHPSPLSASQGFFECGHFRKTNTWLKERYGAGGEIDWNLDVSVTKPAEEAESDIPEPQILDGPDDEAAMIEAAEQAELGVLATRSSKESDLKETDVKTAEDLDSDMAAVHADGTLAVQDNGREESKSPGVEPHVTKEEEASN